MSKTVVLFFYVNSLLYHDLSLQYNSTLIKLTSSSIMIIYFLLTLLTIIIHS